MAARLNLRQQEQTRAAIQTTQLVKRLQDFALAQEGVEIVRNIRDTNWLNGQAWDNGIIDGAYQVDYSSTDLQIYNDLPLLYDESIKLFKYDTGTETIYKRKIEIKHLNASEIRIQVTVTWIGKGDNPFETVVEDHLYNWL